MLRLLQQPVLLPERMERLGPLGRPGRRRYRLLSSVPPVQVSRHPLLIAIACQLIHSSAA